MAEQGAPGADVAVVILTFNEAPNLPHALASVSGWAREVFVVDSFSTDETVQIARGAGATVLQNAFVDYAKQRNFAIQQVPASSGWILFVDADEWLTPELKAEIARVTASNPQENGFYVKWRLMWMGKWIRRGYYPTWILRLFRRGTGRCEERGINEHLIVEGKLGYLEHDFIHEDRKGIDHWIEKHNRYATREALELIKLDNEDRQEEIAARFFGTQAERKRWIRYRLWNRLPPLVRPFLYFFYRLVLRGGFLDGRRAFVYHVLHALWFIFLIDAKYLEMKYRRRLPGASADAIGWHETHARRFGERYRSSAMFRERLRVWEDAIAKLPPGGLVLDLGCGPGLFSVIAARAASRVIAIDGSAGMIALAREAAAESGARNIEFAEGRLEDFRKLVPQAVDAILCSSVVEYLDDPDAFLQSCFAALKPEGVLLVSTPNADSWYRKCERLGYGLARRPRYYRYVKTVETRDAMAARLARAGFRVCETRHFGPAPLLSRVLRPLGLAAASDTLVLFVAMPSKE